MPSIVQEPGLFTPDTTIWKVTRESVVVLGGSCAVLMLLAHPSVAAAVRNHSDVRRNPVARLRRTYDLTLDLVFATRSGAIQAIEQINRRHRAVRGPAYAADDPELLLWVQACLVYSALTSYQAFVGPLSPRERDQYYQDTKEIGVLLGIPRALYPPSIADLDEYLARMQTDGTTIVAEDARIVTDLLFHVRFPIVGRIPLGPLRLIASGLMPATVRDQYRLPWGPFQRATFRATRRFLRTVVRVAPHRIRTLPPARAASLRMRSLGWADS